MQNFFELSLVQLQEILTQNGFEKFRAKQLFEAVYKNKIFIPQQFPSVSTSLKEFAQKNFEFVSAKLVGNKSSEDDTKKYLFELSDGKFVESVMLKAPSDDGKIRKTLCMGYHHSRNDHQQHRHKNNNSCFCLHNLSFDISTYSTRINSSSTAVHVITFSLG